MSDDMSANKAEELLQDEGKSSTPSATNTAAGATEVFPNHDFVKVDADFLPPQGGQVNTAECDPFSTMSSTENILDFGSSDDGLDFNQRLIQNPKSCIDLSFLKHEEEMRRFERENPVNPNADLGEHGILDNLGPIENQTATPENCIDFTDLDSYEKKTSTDGVQVDDLTNPQIGTDDNEFPSPYLGIEEDPYNVAEPKSCIDISRFEREEKMFKLLDEMAKEEESGPKFIAPSDQFAATENPSLLEEHDSHENDKFPYQGGAVLEDISSDYDSNEEVIPQRDHPVLMTHSESHSAKPSETTPALEDLSKSSIPYRPKDSTPPLIEPAPPSSRPREPTPPREVTVQKTQSDKHDSDNIISSLVAGQTRHEPKYILSESTKRSFAVLNPMMNLVYWRDPKKSGVVFGSIMMILLALIYLSLISVVAYASISVIAITITFRVYKNIKQAIQKSQYGHPFKEYLEFDTNISSDKAHELTDVIVSQVNSSVSELKRLFLVEDLIDSAKFGLLLFCLTYVGAWFNGLTLVILGVVALFTLPKVYEQNQTQIDQYVGLVRNQVNDVMTKVRAAIPIGGNKEKAQ